MAGTKGNSGGHNRKTNAEKIRLGARPARLNKNAPIVPRTRSYLDNGLDEIAESFFRYYEPILFNSGIISDADGTLLYITAAKYSMWYRAAEEVRKEPSTFIQKNMNGDVIKIERTPYSKIESEYFTQLCSAMRELGLTPMGRSAIQKIAETGEPENRLKKIT